jgi:type III restriction enzyme
LQENGLGTIEKTFKDIEKHIFRKAINVKAKQENSLYQFKRLKDELEIESVDDLQKDEILGAFKVNIIAGKTMNYEDISNDDKLGIVLKFLDKIFTELKESINPYKGGEFKKGTFKELFGEAKIKTINENNLDDNIARDNEWYVLDGFVGTSEEKGLIEFIKNTMGNLENKHDEIYLLRNEEVYKIYDFEKGRGFQPDFILFLKGKNSLQYQIFIEPKGDEFIGDDGTFRNGKEGWKEIFLEEISEKYGFSNVIKAENSKYRLIGLPFFNESHNGNFTSCFSGLIK